MSWTGHAVIMVLSMAICLGGCGEVRPRPENFVAADYTPITLAELRQTSAPPLAAGQLVQCQAYFWQFLNYDPAPHYYYMNFLRQPISWSDLRWAAVYEKADMRGYFDRVAFKEQMAEEYNLHRLDPVVLYGEMVPLGGRSLYLQVHHIEAADID